MDTLEKAVSAAISKSNTWTGEKVYILFFGNENRYGWIDSRDLKEYKHFLADGRVNVVLTLHYGKH